MDHAARLLLVARICYYLGWIAAIVAALLHIAHTPPARTFDINDRNFLEASILLFVICMASALRAIASARDGGTAGTAKLKTP